MTYIVYLERWQNLHICVFRVGTVCFIAVINFIVIMVPKVNQYQNGFLTTFVNIANIFNKVNIVPKVLTIIKTVSEHFD